MSGPARFILEPKVRILNEAFKDFFFFFPILCGSEFFNMRENVL
jgi:hypothetical protein